MVLVIRDANQCNFHRSDNLLTLIFAGSNLRFGIFAAMQMLVQLSLLQKLNGFDQWLFIKLNSVLTNPVFDQLMPFLRTSYYWTPLYLFLIVFATLNFKQQGLWWVLFFITTAALTDLTGTYVFKHNIQRLRPCNDPDFFMHVRLLVDHCSGGYSFTSNHAASHFGLATFFYISMKPVLKKWASVGFFWAGFIAYAQVYVGVHYPLDVLAGTALGLLLGGLTGSIFNKRFGFTIFDNQPMVSS